MISLFAKVRFEQSSSSIDPRMDALRVVFLSAHPRRWQSRQPIRWINLVPAAATVTWYYSASSIN